MTEINDIRRRNLKVLVDRAGSPTNLAASLELSGPSYISQLLSAKPNRPLTEKTARKFEKKLNLPVGWLDSEEETLHSDALSSLPNIHVSTNNVSASQLSRVDPVLIHKALMAVEDALDEVSLALSRDKRAHLVSMVIDQASTTGDVDTSFVKNVINLLKT